MGVITIELYWNHAPKTCQNFFELARKGYYDSTIFHRIISEFIIQGGDPTGTGNFKFIYIYFFNLLLLIKILGKGGQSIYGPKFDDEITDELKHTGAGIISMANSGPNTNGSQFFITLAPAQHLDGKHTIFGRVATGMKVFFKLKLIVVFYIF